jgi:hypothetical protein
LLFGIISRQSNSSCHLARSPNTLFRLT